jgi:hypothetical protein
MTKFMSLPTLTAKWTAEEYEDSFTLQIELGNDRALLLTIWKNGDPNDVSVWDGSGSHSFTQTEVGEPDDPLECFKEWIVEAAVRPESFRPIGHGRFIPNQP